MKNIPILLLTLFTMCTANNSSDRAKEVVTATNQDQGQNLSKTNEDEKENKLDPNLFGEWVSTEILGAGTQFSMTNETPMEFLEDGTFLTWPGRSIASDYSREEDKSKASRGKWYTDGNKLYLTDPAAGQDAITYYQVNNTGFMLTDGGKEKKLFQRR